MKEVLGKFEKDLNGVFEYFRSETASIRGNRPSPVLVEDVLVEYFGQKMPIKQLASVSVLPPRELQISVWDANAVQVIESAVGEKLKCVASRDGNLVRVSLPELTQERKEELIKMVKQKAEEARIKSRSIRDESKKEIEKMEKSAELTEDDKFKAIDDMQETIKDFNKKIDEFVEKKSLEINE